MTLDYSPLWRWVGEREAVRLRKTVVEREMLTTHPVLETEAEAIAWTDESTHGPVEGRKIWRWRSDCLTLDPVLSTYRFCNVRREDDRGTIWIRENIREPFADHPYLWLMLCIARQINWPDTLAELIAEAVTGAWPSAAEFDPCAMTSVLNDRQARGEKVYTGAYMISAPPTKGADKQSYIAETVCGALWDRRERFAKWDGALLQRTHELITRSNGWGPFMAYQAVVDMRFTRLLDHAPDVATWAAAGPGTIRGLNRLHGRPVTASLNQGQALAEMKAIYRLAEVETGVSMDFSDVPNILCETDKYLRVQNGEGKPRALYVPGRGS